MMAGGLLTIISAEGEDMVVECPAARKPFPPAAGLCLGGFASPVPMERRRSPVDMFYNTGISTYVFVLSMLRRANRVPSSEPTAAVGNPPTDAANWNRRTQCPPERKNDISHQTQDRESRPEDFPLHW
jgi:hypothetical protein